MELLKERILKDGIVKPGNVLKVDSFLNHQMDIPFINELGKEFKRIFADAPINKILTIEASGIGIACIVAQYFNVPVVFAKKAQSLNLDGEMYKRNGTKYDVRIILINGRKTGPFKRIAPPVKSKARAEQVKTFDELYKRIQDDIQSLQQMGNLFDDTAGETRTAEDGRRSENRPVSDRKQSGERTEPGRDTEGIRPDTNRR